MDRKKKQHFDPSLFEPRTTSFVPHEPTSRQAAFLMLDCLEAFYGGAGGGGKSDALLMAALQYVDVPGYSALIIRRSMPDLAMPNALLDRSRRWLGGEMTRAGTRPKSVGRLQAELHLVSAILKTLET